MFGFGAFFSHVTLIFPSHLSVIRFHCRAGHWVQRIFFGGIKFLLQIQMVLIFLYVCRGNLLFVLHKNTCLVLS